MEMDGWMDFVHQRKHPLSRVLQSTQGEGRRLPTADGCASSPARRQVELTRQPALRASEAPRPD